MAAKHGTRRRYVEGCHCPDCTEANSVYQANYRQGRAGGESATPSVAVSVSSPVTPGPVEVAVGAEVRGLAEVRPGLAEVALALARILDNPKAISQQPGRGEGIGRGAGKAGLGISAWPARWFGVGADDDSERRRLKAQILHAAGPPCR